MFDFLSCFREVVQEYWTDGKNVKSGNINIRCPFCNDHSNHLGCHPGTGKVYCWRCGSHDLKSLLLKIGTQEPSYYFKKYGTKKTQKAVQEKKVVAGKCVLPPRQKEMNTVANNYLKARGFDPVRLEQEYDIYSTGPVGRHKFRIVIPIQYKGEVVSFVARDYTNRQQIRYLTATREEEAVHHKDIFYGLDGAADYDTVLLVEGITDMWRVGAGCIASFGTSVTAAQVRLLAGLRKKIYILFDNEDAAQKKAGELATQLELLDCEVVVLQLPEGVADPGELSEQAVQKLRACVWGK
jgi:hypothetical protein